LFAQQAALHNTTDAADDCSAADVTVDETNGASFVGCIAPVADDDGVLLTETHADEADMRSAALTSIEQSQMFAQGRSPCDSV
jgi:hypothetical protein